MILAVATLLLQFQAVPATISSGSNTPTNSQTSTLALAAAASPAPAAKPIYVTSETESSTSRMNVASVELVSENSKPGAVKPVSRP